MAISQGFIDLLNVPVEQLRAAAEERQVAGFNSMGKWALAQALADLPREELEELSEGYLYAGRTSLSFYRLDEPPATTAEGGHAPAVPPEEEEAALAGQELDDDGVVEVLEEMSEGGDPFNEAARPREVTDMPKLVVARRRDDGSMLMTFAVQQAVAQVIHNFQLENVYADDFFNAVLYPDAGLVEVRTNQQMAQRFKRRWLEDFAAQFELEVFPVTITPGDFEALRQELDAGMTRFTGKVPVGGSMDTIEVTVSPTFVDLRGEADFEQATAGTDQVRGDLRFTRDGRSYTVRVSRVMGSIYFVTPAPEETIDYVRDALRRVKVRHLAP